MSSCGLPTKAVVQFCLTMSKISYQRRFACFWNGWLICKKGLVIAPPVVGCLPKSEREVDHVTVRGVLKALLSLGYPINYAFWYLY